MTLTGPSDTGLAQPAQASLNALIAVTGALIEHGPVPDNAVLRSSSGHQSLVIGAPCAAVMSCLRLPNAVSRVASEVEQVSWVE